MPLIQDHFAGVSRFGEAHRQLEATKSKRAMKREFMVVATVIPRMIVSSAFSDPTEFSEGKGYLREDLLWFEDAQLPNLTKVALVERGYLVPALQSRRPDNQVMETIIFPEASNSAQVRACSYAVAQVTLPRDLMCPGRGNGRPCNWWKQAGEFVRIHPEGPDMLYSAVCQAGDLAQTPTVGDRRSPASRQAPPP
jgi:hypothetical protein